MLKKAINSLINETVEKGGVNSLLEGESQQGASSYYILPVQQWLANEYPEK